VILALLTGAGVGLGLLMLARGLAPPRAPLAAALARLEVDTTRPRGAWPSTPTQAPHGAADGRGWGVALAGRPLARLAGRLGLQPSWLRRDLAILGRSPERHMADKVVLALFGLLLAPATAAGLAVIGISPPLPLPLAASLLLAVGGFVVPDAGVRADAAARRRDLRHALGSFLDLTVIALAGGAGVEGALTDAASIGRGVPPPGCAGRLGPPGCGASRPGRRWAGSGRSWASASWSSWPPAWSLPAPRAPRSAPRLAPRRCRCAPTSSPRPKPRRRPPPSG